MKFKKLIAKFEKFARKKGKGKPVKPEKLKKLQQLLAEKKMRYEEKLKNTADSEKQKSIETKLKVVVAQLNKSKELLGKDRLD